MLFFSEFSLCFSTVIYVSLIVYAIIAAFAFKTIQNSRCVLVLKINLSLMVYAIVATFVFETILFRFVCKSLCWSLKSKLPVHIYFCVIVPCEEGSSLNKMFSLCQFCCHHGVDISKTVRDNYTVFANVGHFFIAL